MTGATGYVARQILPASLDHYQLRLIDVNVVLPAELGVLGSTVARSVHTMDLSDPDLEQHRWAFRNVDVVLRLAYHWPQDRDAERGYRDERVNVDMAYHVYQLALEERVRRVVMASSNHAADWYERLVHAGLKDAVHPDERPLAEGFYGWAKAAYEHMGFLYAQGAFGRRLEAVQLRIGAPRDLAASDYRGREELLKRDLGAYISPRDFAHLVRRSIDAPVVDDDYGIPFQIVYGISANTRAFWSIANARRVLGYAPEDDSELRFAEMVRNILAQSAGRVGSRAREPCKALVDVAAAAPLAGLTR